MQRSGNNKLLFLLFNLALIGSVLSLQLPRPALAEAGVSKPILSPFTSDGCSEFPDGTAVQKTLWLDCCVAHDRAYWLGGSALERKAADAALQSCVSKVGQPEIALVMLAGVRVGGSPYWPTRFRWGYGWPYWDGWLPRGYRELSPADLAQVAGLETPEAAESSLSGAAASSPLERASSLADEVGSGP